jgi:hypothetical protein
MIKSGVAAGQRDETGQNIDNIKKEIILLAVGKKKQKSRIAVLILANFAELAGSRYGKNKK